MDRPSWAPEEIDITRPSVARVYDFALGGSHNFAADREFAGQMFAAMPDGRRALQDNREFLRRAVRYLCAEGIDQFLDLGSGIPTVGNVHEVAHAANPQARIVYVDHDPVAVVHSRELLAGDDRIAVLAADLRRPRSVLDAPEVRATLDLTRPVAVMLVSVLHFVADADEPAAFVGQYMRATAPGSHLTISHANVERNEQAAAAAAVYDRPASPGTMVPRPHAQIAAMFGDAALVEPGLVRLPLWRPESPDDVGAGVEQHLFLAGVARIP